MEKISVIIPIFNTKPRLLSVCVKSVINQTYSNLEIILVDDGSDKDDTINMCRELESGDSRIKVVTQSNKGESGARKAGIDLSNGKFIMFLDSDDCLTKDACEYLKKLMKIGDYDFAEAASIQVKDIENLKEIEKKKEINVQKLEGSKRLLDAVVQGCLQPISWSLWGKMYKAEIIKESYIVYNDIYRGVDVLTLACYMINAKKSIHSDKVIYYYNKGNLDSITAQKCNVRNLSMLRLWNEMVCLYKKYALIDSFNHVRGIYADCLAGCLLECKLYKYENYKFFIKDIKSELRRHYKDVFFNKYMPNRVKNIIVMLFPLIFDIYWWIKKISKQKAREKI